MPAPSVPDGFLVADLCIRTPQKMLRSRVYYSTDTAPADESQLTVCCDAIKTFFTPGIPQLLPDTNYFSRVEGKYYGAGGTMIFAQSSAAEGVGLIDAPDDASEDGGSESEDIMPTETALIIQRKTGLRGRSNYGRVFLGGIAESVNYRGQIASAHVIPVKTLGAKFAADINVSGGGYTTVLHARHWNRKTNSMKIVTRCYVVGGLGSRKDRRVKAFMERLT